MKLFPRGIDLTDAEVACLLNDLYDSDGGNGQVAIERWVLAGSIRGKIAKCKSRLLNEWRQKIAQDDTVDTVPANEDDFIAMVLLRPDYKNRAEREAE